MRLKGVIDLVSSVVSQVEGDFQFAYGDRSDFNKLAEKNPTIAFMDMPVSTGSVVNGFDGRVYQMVITVSTEIGMDNTSVTAVDGADYCFDIAEQLYTKLNYSVSDSDLPVDVGSYTITPILRWPSSSGVRAGVTLSFSLNVNGPCVLNE